MKIDMHVHTEFSCDSKAKMEKYIEVAMQKNVDGICFTDHVDYNIEDFGFGFYNKYKYFEAINQYKTNAKCMLLSGIEFSEPHLYKREFEELSQIPYDFIIGSIHWIGNLFPCKEVRERYSAKEFYSMYWDEVLKTVEYGGFQCLGHIDFPKRYYGEIVYEESQMKKIFDTMLNNNIVLEVNTSSIRKGVLESMPGLELLQIYKECGGKYVTIGSDAHIEDDLAADFGQVEELIGQVGLEKVYFKDKKIIKSLEEQ
jgi:histidinol-phosphatase (PHP family)